MNRRSLEQHLRAHGCMLCRHGAKHDVWTNAALDVTVAVPRHREIKNSTARAICRQLGVTVPPGV